MTLFCAISSSPKISAYLATFDAFSSCFTNFLLVKSNSQETPCVLNSSVSLIASSESLEMVSNAEGKFIIFGLDQGTYWLKETDAPDGYRQLLDPIELTLTPTFTSERQDYVAGEGATEKILQALAGSAHITSFYDGLFGNDEQVLETDIENGSANLTVVNKVGSKLPVTGSNMTIIMLATGTALMALAANKQRKTVNAVED